MFDIFECLCINYYENLYKKNSSIPLDIQTKIEKYNKNIVHIKYLLGFQAYIIRICEYLDYSTHDSYRMKFEKLKCYNFSEYKELDLYFCETFYESYTHKDFIDKFYKKIYNKHNMIHNLIIAYEKENKLIYQKINNYL